MGVDGVARSREREVQDQRHGQEPHRRLQLDGERTGHRGRDRQRRRGGQRRDERQLPHAGAVRLAALLPLDREREAGEHGEREVERQRQRPLHVRPAARGEEQQHQPHHRGGRAQGRDAAQQRNRGEREDRRRRMGDVADHEARHAGERRGRGEGVPGLAASRLAQRHERRHELRCREQHAGDERRPDREQVPAIERLPARELREEREQQPRAEQERRGPHGIPGPGQQDERAGRRQPQGPPGRGSRAAERVLEREQQQRQRRRGHDRRGVSEVRHQVGAEREAEGSRERPHGPRAQPACVEVRERAREPERDQHERLERGEGRKRSEREHQRVEGARAIRGEQRRAREDRTVPGRHLAAAPRAEDLDAQRQVERRARARRQQPALVPGGGVRHERGRSQQQEQQPLALVARHGVTLARHSFCGATATGCGASWIHSSERSGG